LLNSEKPAKDDTHTFATAQRKDRGSLKVLRFKPVWTATAGGALGAMAIDRAGARVAIAVADGITLLDVLNGTELSRLAEPAAEWTALEFSPDDRLLLAISNDGHCCLLELESGRGLARFELSAGVRGCSWRPDGTQFAW